MFSRSNLEELLQNSSYNKAAHKYGAIFRDQPIHPLEKAIYNIEYVMRHGELTHLNPKIGHLHIFQLYLVDVWGFCGVIMVLGTLIIHKLLTICNRPRNKANGGMKN